jgi:uncharacterized membrane protein YbjE (DUF340 family)
MDVVIHIFHPILSVAYFTKLFHQSVYVYVYPSAVVRQRLSINSITLCGATSDIVVLGLLQSNVSLRSQTFAFSRRNLPHGDRQMLAVHSETRFTNGKA